MGNSTHHILVFGTIRESVSFVFAHPKQIGLMLLLPILATSSLFLETLGNAEGDELTIGFIISFIFYLWFVGTSLVSLHRYVLNEEKYLIIGSQRHVLKAIAYIIGLTLVRNEFLPPELWPLALIIFIFSPFILHFLVQMSLGWNWQKITSGMPPLSAKNWWKSWGLLVSSSLVGLAAAIPFAGILGGIGYLLGTALPQVLGLAAITTVIVMYFFTALSFSIAARTDRDRNASLNDSAI